MGEFPQAKVLKKGVIRVLGGIKSEILADVEPEELLAVCYEMEEWVKNEDCSSLSQAHKEDKPPHQNASP